MVGNEERSAVSAAQGVVNSAYYRCVSCDARFATVAEFDWHQLRPGVSRCGASTKQHESSLHTIVNEYAPWVRLGLRRCDLPLLPPNQVVDYETIKQWLARRGVILSNARALIAYVLMESLTSMTAQSVQSRIIERYGIRLSLRTIQSTFRSFGQAGLIERVPGEMRGRRGAISCASHVHIDVRTLA